MLFPYGKVARRVWFYLCANLFPIGYEFWMHTGDIFVPVWRRNLMKSTVLFCCLFIVGDSTAVTTLEGFWTNFIHLFMRASNRIQFGDVGII